MLESIRAARLAGRHALDEAQGKLLVAGFGVPVPRGTVVQSDAQADAACAALRPPLALKAMASGLLHKSDAGGVRLGLASAAEVRDAMRGMRADPRIAAHHIEGFLLEEMAAPGHELVIGGRWDPHFGPVVMLGMGGIYVEVFADVSFRLCPIDRDDALDMLSELRGASALAGARGGVAASQDAIIAVLLAVGGPDGLMLAAGGDIAELDLNPVIVDASQACAVDARILLSAESA